MSTKPTCTASPGPCHYFHRCEVAFCGYSGSGKTTLISRLLDHFSPLYSIGYVKHDAHRFAIDIPGKDTFAARQHGAQTVCINDADHWALVSNGSLPHQAIQAIYAPLDMVFVEGYTDSSMPKVIVMDRAEKILDPACRNQISSVFLYAGIRDAHPSLDAPYFHRDDVASIGKQIVAFLGLDIPITGAPRDPGAQPG